MKIVQYQFNNQNVGHRVPTTKDYPTEKTIVGVSLPFISLENWVACNTLQLHVMSEVPQGEPLESTEITLPLKNHRYEDDFADSIRDVLPDFIKLKEKDEKFYWKNIGPHAVELYSIDYALHNTLFPVSSSQSLKLPPGNLQSPSVSSSFPISTSLKALRINIPQLDIQVPYIHVNSDDYNKRQYHHIPKVVKKMPDQIALEVHIENCSVSFPFKGTGVVEFYIK